MTRALFIVFTLWLARSRGQYDGDGDQSLSKYQKNYDEFVKHYQPFYDTAKEEERQDQSQDEDKDDSWSRQNSEQEPVAAHPNTTVMVRVWPQSTGSDVAIGIFHFKQSIISNKASVDKSMVIKKIIEAPEKVIMITLPPKFGKSMIIDMLKNFFEVEVDSQGVEFLPKKNSFNHKTFSKGTITMHMVTTRLANPPLISNYPDLIARYQGRHPVIYLNLANVTGISYTEIFSAVRRRVAKTFLRHNYMIGVMRNDQGLQRREFDPVMLQKFCDYCSPDLMGEMDLEQSLTFLSTVLYRHFGRRVYILIDDADAPILEMLHGVYFRIRDEQRLLRFYEALLRTTFQNNTYLEKGVLTSRLRLGGKQIPVPKEQWLEVHSLDNPWSEFFGFTRDEVDELFKVYEIPADLAAQAHNWYCGYLMNPNSVLFVYNPWSIMNFIRHKYVDNYWSIGSMQFFVRSLIQMRPVRTILEKLILGNKFTYTLTDYLHSNNLIRLKMVINRLSANVLDKQTVSLMLTYLADCGYLSFTYHHAKATNMSTIQFRLPNKEIIDDMFARLRLFYTRKECIAWKDMDHMALDLNDLIMGDNITSFALTNSFHKLIESLPIYVKSQNKIRPFIVNGRLVQSIRSFLAMKMHFTYGYKTKVEHNTTQRPDLVLRKGDLVAIIKIGFNTRFSRTILNQARDHHKKVYNNLTRIIRCIGIAVSITKQTAILAHIQSCLPNPTANASEPSSQASLAD